MTDIQVREDKIIHVVRQAPQHECVWGKGGVRIVVFRHV
jgi:hypothetical protein